MNAPGNSTRPERTWSAHSTRRSLVVAAVLAVAPVLAVAALSYPTLAVAFAGGAALAAVLATAPALGRRLERRLRRTGGLPVRPAGNRR